MWIVLLDHTLMRVVSANHIGSSLASQRAEHFGEPRLPVDKRSEAIKADPLISD
jgi:hypothetical protein